MKGTTTSTICPDKFKGTLSVDEFIKQFKDSINDKQIEALKALRDKGKLW
jgi:hypothetical protein